jgi:hypothetical protein
MPKAKAKRRSKRVSVNAKEIVLIPFEKLKPYEKNPRINDSAVARVAQSISAHGFNSPLLVNGEGVIIAGHTRYLAASSLGMKSVPCIIVNIKTERAYRIADNRTAEYSTWDFELLTDEIEALHEAGLDIELTGFDTEELKRLSDIPDIIAGSEMPDDLPASDLLGAGGKGKSKVVMIPVKNQKEVAYIAKRLAVEIKAYKDIKQTTVIALGKIK